ncbi:hypothetical protein HZS61_004969 [Fusarium oxysporum f. sp. conglutinans]|uniref:Uncharacterized protein n=1 Tax=Fusarium oxysporum f. sp. conglutinans TaxID=100902 RepID=A0A8H6GBQ3_FUSOX|nr:hypothetical protein HZS61_004969 [Fusarium oxysporum f. sp. conglutinans]KAG6978923.1 hypothetical protein FocnCong_v011010 [Fusarium oxysporum f. sp. conglutinans]KAI8401207.1 hypothetical protein FOFC_18076 [Fusarium oxysporum]
MHEKQLPSLPPQPPQDQVSPRAVVAPFQPPSQRHPLGHISQQVQPGGGILTSLKQDNLKLRRENDALRRSMAEKENKIEMLQKLNSQHRQRIDEQARQTTQLFQTIHSALKNYRDDKKGRAVHLPKGSSEEIVSGAFSGRGERWL